MEMTPTHYLRIEGVNLGNFVFDTRDLSTIRGASLMLLDAVEVAKAALQTKVTELQTLSQGASSGLFAIDTTDVPSATAAVRHALITAFPHATFVVDVVDAPKGSNEFRAGVVESLLAADRWRQMQATSLAVPEQNTGPARIPPACGRDWIRPARQNGHSTSTHRRREHGKEAKQSFYGKIIDRVARRHTDSAVTLDTCKQRLPRFAREFEEIAQKKGTALDGKIAVFYADGNNFGKKQATHCADATRQSAFDTYLRSSRESFLTDFLETECLEDEWQNTTQKGETLVRFETLLWGGDEVMFVMPAGLAWRFAGFFFDKLGGLNLKDAGAELPDEALTHAAAMVFCQHHAPIDRIKRLAKDQMADLAKEADRTRDSLVVVALESFDHLGSSYAAAMEKRYGGAVAVKDTILRGHNGKNLAQTLNEIAGAVGELRESPSFARSQLRRLVVEMIADPTNAGERAKFAQKGGKWRPPPEFRNADKDEKIDVGQILHDRLLPCFANEVALWIQLEELWDYAL